MVIAFHRTGTIYVVLQSCGIWSWMPGNFRLSQPSWTDWHTWPQSHAGIDLTPDKMNFENFKPLYHEFQKYKVIILTVVSGQPKNMCKSQL